METTIVNFKTNKAKKVKAQKKAAELGISLSTVLNHYLEEFILDESIRFGIVSEEPTKYLLDSLKESEEDIKAGRVVSFDNPQEAVKYLRGLSRDDKRKD